MAGGCATPLMDIIQKKLFQHLYKYVHQKDFRSYMHYIHLNPLNTNKIFLDLIIITKNYKLVKNWLLLFLLII